MIRLYTRANVIPDPNKFVKKKEKKFDSIHYIKPYSVEKLYSLEKLTVIDFRPEEEYHKGHLKQAKSIPFASTDVKKVISELDKEATYLIYASGEKENKVLSEMFTHFEMKNVYILHGGYEEWLRFQKEQVPQKKKE